MFGMRISLNINNQIRYRSLLGGSVTLSLVAIITIAAINIFQQYLEQENMLITVDVLVDPHL
jgi:hypothetical protein